MKKNSKEKDGMRKGKEDMCLEVENEKSEVRWEREREREEKNEKGVRVS